ncbi:NADH-cytochrome b5 reductase-like isoform X2 [Eleutherodactylus coqui]|uniref:NADH-cytochrome b5 reductase-like isoform X2 n=1 Tax=Eleutherodactylus coqui TaxID=57060 RepID=UPI003462D5AB
MNSDKNDWMSLKPVEPTPAQCCGSGCTPCIYDLYQAELELWEKAKERDDPALLRRIKLENHNVPLSTDTFTEFKLCSVEQETEDTSRYRFQLPSGASLGLKLGQHLVVYEHGLMSQYVKCWRQGDCIAWRGPFGGFLYKPNKYGELLMLCSGTGIAPMLPILTHVTDNEDDETFLTLVVCARNFQNVYLKNLLKEQSRYWNVRIFYVLSQEESLEHLPMSYKENSKLGRIDSAFLAMVLKTCRRKPYTLVCGSVSFVEDMTGMMKQLEQDGTSIFSF